MNCKSLSPEDIIKLSSSISLILTQKFDQDELVVIKNILCSVANNISAFQGQYYIYEKCKKNNKK